MTNRLPAVVLCLGILLSGCQSPAPVAIAPALAPSTTADAPKPTNNDAEIIRFLNTLAQTIDGQQRLDADIARRYRALLGDDPQTLLYQLADGKPVLRNLPRATDHAVTAIKVAHEAKLHKLWDTFLRTPPPPSCGRLLRHFEILLTEQINRERRIVVEINSAILHPGATPAVSLRNNASYGHGYAATRARRLQQLHDDYKHLRNTSPARAMQIPPLP